MAKIIVLDEFTASQIAAGEVVERPVSVVKELVENSIDAGASRVVVDLEEGGLESISVHDNGCGMDGEELPLAFQRHATSKIVSAGDLSRLTTLGFRGEALPSIAAVAKLSVTTRPYEKVNGFRAESEGGSPVTVGPAGCPPGTTVVVRKLFFNTPARRKTMKSPSTEGSLCGELISRLALARPDVSFELKLKGRRVFFSSGTGRLIDAVISVYGPDQIREMVEIKASDSDVQLTGYTGKPSLSRSSRNHLTVIINGRYVHCQVIGRAVEEAYRTLLPQGRKPVAVLAMSIRPELLDVNIHPAKLEVRLLEEAKLARLVTGAVKEALMVKEVIPVPVPAAGKKNVPMSHQPSIFFAGRTEPPAAAPRETDLNPAGLAEDFTSNCRETVKHLVQGDPEGKGFSPQTVSPEKVREGENLYLKGGGFPRLQALAHLPPTYILAGGEDGLYIVDQHAAHERVLYEQFLKKRNKETPVQYLLAPLTLDLEYSETALLIEKILWFADAGFIIEHFGGNTFLLRGVPLDFPPGQVKDLFLDLLDYFKDKGTSSNREDFFIKLASALACKNAVKAGASLAGSAMDALLLRLTQTDNPFTCPHGRPTVIHLSLSDLKNRFKR